MRLATPEEIKELERFIWENSRDLLPEECKLDRKTISVVACESDNTTIFIVNYVEPLNLYHTAPMVDIMIEAYVKIHATEISDVSFRIIGAEDIIVFHQDEKTNLNP